MIRSTSCSPIRHAAKRNGVESEASEVLGWVDSVFGPEAFPFEQELGRNVQHVIKHSSDRRRAKCGHEQAVYSMSDLAEISLSKGSARTSDAPFRGL